jgi:ADP-dependent NAD(P)H-hydrate dehydratase / NAD(P)H-hydrate epimerase
VKERLSVVTRTEMARLEKETEKIEGLSQKDLIYRVGQQIASFLEVEFPQKPPLFFLVGKGNNGADACCAALFCLEKGFSVQIFSLFPLNQCNSLCQEGLQLLKERGARIVEQTKPFFPSKGVIIDGVFGSGFQGEVSEFIACCFEISNQSGLPIYAIDIPSGLHADTGEVGKAVIRATKTLWIGLPKLGFFLKEGWNCIGCLIGIELFSKAILERASPSAFLMDERCAAPLLPKMIRNRHKYQAGYLLNVAGSGGMSGAAFLSSMAALRAGCGLVRLFYGKGLEKELGGAPWEIIKEPQKLSSIIKESKRAQAMLVGPGLGRTTSAQRFFSQLLPQVTLPTVVDGDALFFLSLHPLKKWKIPPQSLFTPHIGEMERILQKKPDLSSCQNLSEETQRVWILKGGPSWIFSPHELPFICPLGNPGMATGGTGDVLAGILASFLAQGLSPYQAAQLGLIFHGECGNRAAQIYTERALVASDLLQVFPKVFHTLQQIL